MSKFNALNQTPQDEQLEEDEHPRELQVEEGFMMFQSALWCMKKKNYDEALEKFKELFQLAIIKPNKWGFYSCSSPTLDSLRYLAYRNRGMFYYSYLMDNYNVMESDDVVNYILKVVEDLTESMQHSDADNSVTELLELIFRSFKSKKLERLVTEYELTKADNQFLLLGRLNRSKILPQLKNVIEKYALLLEDIDDKYTAENSMIIDSQMVINKNTEDLNEVLKKIYNMKTQDEKTMKELEEFEITIKKITWEELVSALKGLLPNMKTSNMLVKDYDTYAESEYPIEAIKIVLSDSALVNINSVSTNSQMIEATDNNLATENSLENSVHNNEEKGKELVLEEIKNKTSPIANEVISENIQDSFRESQPDVKDGTESTVATDDPKLTKKRSSEVVNELSRPAQRSSKRVKNEQEVDEQKIYEIHQNFLQEFTNDISKLDIKFEFTPESLESLITESPGTNSKIYHSDFFHCLKSWNSKHADIFTQHSPSTSRHKATESNFIDGSTQLASVLKYNATNEYGEKENFSNKLDEFYEVKVEKFVEQINNNKMHFHEVRFKIIKELLSDYELTKRLVISHLWSKNLYHNIEWLLLSTESGMYEFLKSSYIVNKYLILSIIEVLVNMVGGINDEINVKTFQGTKVNDLKNTKYKIDLKTKKWIELADNIDFGGDMCWKIQFQWAKFSFLQYSEYVVNKKMVSLCYQMEKDISSYDTKMDIIYPNYQFIPRLNFNIVKANIKKINIIEKLTVIDLDTENIDTDVKQDGNMLLLEKVLLKNSCDMQEETDEKETSLFIEQSPFMVQVNLWKFLFNFYFESKNVNQLTKCYFHILHLLLKKLNSFEYLDQIEENRQQMLLLCLANVDYFTTKTLDLLADHAWIRYESPVADYDHGALLDIFSIYYIVFYFETSAKVDNSLKSFFQRAHKSAAKIKHNITSILALILYFFSSFCDKKFTHSESGTLTTHFVNNAHALLGEFKSCDSAHGHFLSLSENLLCRFINQETYYQLLQILWCRYHYSLNNDTKSFNFHSTKPVPIDKVNSLPLGIYLIKLQYLSKNPLLVTGNKSTLKQVLDNIIHTLGDPCNSPNFFITQNKYKFEEYLSLPITTNHLRKTFAGKLEINFSTPNDDYQEAIQTGLYYISSIQALNLYKIRKKSMQARPSELDSIINMIKTDILYNCKRYESWYLLGKCFSYIVEDDLMWTSDKLNVPERKCTISLNQRKAILCYTMAINIYYSEPSTSRDDQKIVVKILESLATEFINGLLKPMEMECFQYTEVREFLKLSDEGELLTSTVTNATNISLFNIEQAILLSFNRANKFRLTLMDKKDPNERWENYYYISRVLFKFGREKMMKDIMKNILKACQVANSESTSKANIIEPHYYLITMCYKWVKLGILNPKDAVAFLKKDAEFFDVDSDFWEVDSTVAIDYQKKSIFKKMIELLRYIEQSDKRNWHHRPAYRIAKILFEDFHDIDGAIDEMSPMMSLKSINKNLINIWKPDFERPGKHFVYTYQYIMFYLDLLFLTKDHLTIGLIAKKIRRFSSGMAYSSEVIEKSVSMFIRCVSVSLQFDEKYYTEQVMPTINFQDFTDINKELLNNFNEKEYPSNVLEALQISYQLKKGNNGITFDGVCLSIYFKYFYLPYMEKHSKLNLIPETQQLEFVLAEQPGLNSTSLGISTQSKQVNIRKRVSKKDAFEVIKNITDKVS